MNQEKIMIKFLLSSANVEQYLDFDNNPTQYDYIFNLIEQSKQKKPPLEENNLTTYTNEQFSSANDELVDKLIIDQILNDLPPLKTSQILENADQKVSTNNTQLVNQIPINNLTLSITNL